MAKITYRKKKLFPLYAKTDETKVMPILDALKAQGFPVAGAGEEPRKGGVMLLFLTDHFQEDPTRMETFFRCDAKGIDAVPVNLDGTKPPEVIENALYSRNTIFAKRYSIGELASRIATAKPFEVTQKPLPIILAAAAAVLVLAGLIVLLIRLLPAKEAAVIEPDLTPAPTAEPIIPAEAGLLPEDLEKVYELIIVGDTLNYFTGTEGWVSEQGLARVGAEHFANRTEENGIAHWYSKADGHEIELAAWNDLDFLRYMKNVKFITLVRVSGELPDLSGLTNLDNVELFECSMEGIAGLSGTRIRNFGYSGNTLTDFSPLSGCERLRYANLTLYAPIPADLTSFGPPELVNLMIDTDSSARTVDLSGLKNCPELSVVRLDSLPLTDLNCLSECKKLRELELMTMPNLIRLDGLEEHQSLERLFVDYTCENLADMTALSDNTSLKYIDLHNEALSDLSWLSNAKDLEEIQLWNTHSVRNLHGLEEHTKLLRLYMEGLDRLTELSALQSCTNIHTIQMFQVFNLSDVSPIVKLPKLNRLEIYGSDLSNVDFLSEIVNTRSFSFGVSEVDNWEGLSALPRYSYLNITDSDGSALPYIHNTPVAEFELWNRAGTTNLNSGTLDLSLLPQVSRRLTLHCVRSLETLPSLDLWDLCLDDCPLLTSLDGIERLHELSYLRIQNCSRLSDWSALEHKTMDSLELAQLFTLPDFTTLKADFLRLESIFDLEDLSCLEGYTRENYHIELFDVDGVTDLSPLYHLKGNFLKIPAHLQTQAEDLVNSGLLNGYEVEYPEGWWEPAKPHVELLSLDELDTLPSAVLKRVKKLNMVGDVIFSWDDYWLDQQWDDGTPTFTLRSNDGDESHDIVIEQPGTLTDFSKIAQLTGLEELSLFNQTFTSLEGAQNLQNLWKLEVAFSPALTDASAAFTLQELEELRLQYTGVTNIGGIQNLQKLRWMDLNGLKLDDLTPLGAIPEDCEFSFEFPLMTFEDFLALPDSVLSRIREIGIFGSYVMKDPWGDLWIEEDWDGGDKPKLYIHDNLTGERIPVGQGSITDLGFLNRLPNLDCLHLYGQSIESLDGIEAAGRLGRFRCQWTDLPDLSPLFELENLHEICVSNSETVTSIEGVQKLKHLTELNIGSANLTDIGAIAEIDYTFCMTPDEDGNEPYFNLSVDNLQGKIPDEQYAVLSAVPSYHGLNIFNTDCALWMDAVKDTKIREIHAGGCRFTNETFRQFIEQHPELEYIKVSWTPELTDISPLLTLSDLRAACVSNDMRQAIDSLGDGYGFALEIE